MSPNVKKILMGVLIILLIYFIFKAFSNSSSQISSQQDATVSSTIAASDLPSGSNTQNYTYSTWIYIDDWNYKYGEKKTILGRLDASGNPSPVIALGAFSNDALISVQCYPDSANKEDAGSEQVHNCNVPNIPLQAWVNLLISLNGRTLDVYVDGKLVKTCVLPGVAKIANASPVLITPNGGFSGYTSNIQYWANPTNPQEAWNIYKKGFGGSLMGNLFNKYRIKISFLEDNTETTSFEI